MRLINNLKSKAFLSHLSASVLAVGCSTAVIAEQQVLNVYNWSDYIDPMVLENFQKETGIKLNYDVYDSNEVLETKLMTGASGYDVVVPTGAFLERQAKVGVYAPIDESLLSNAANLDQDMLSKVARHDPGNKYGVPYTWGTIGLGYNVAELKKRLGDVPFDSLDLLFKPEVVSKLQDCGVSVLDSPAEVISMALHYLGLDPNSEKKSDLKKATALLKSVRPYYTKFTSSQFTSDLANGELCLAMGYNGDVLQAQGRAVEAGQGIEIEYRIPKEGTLVWFDLMAIPADAPNKEAAHVFIDYILRPENGASVSNYAFFAVANNKVEPFLLDEVKNDQGIYPDEAVKASLFTQNTHTAKYDRLLTRAWTTIKTNR